MVLLFEPCSFQLLKAYLPYLLGGKTNQAKVDLSSISSCIHTLLRSSLLTIAGAIFGYFSYNIKHTVSVPPFESKMFPFGLTSVTLTLANSWVDDHIKCEGRSCSISEAENRDIISLRPESISEAGQVTWVLPDGICRQFAESLVISVSSSCSLQVCFILSSLGKRLPTVNTSQLAR